MSEGNVMRSLEKKTKVKICGSVIKKTKKKNWMRRRRQICWEEGKFYEKKKTNLMRKRQFDEKKKVNLMRR